MRAATGLRLSLAAAGVAALGFGVRGLLTDAQIREPSAVGEWALGGLLAHDALLAPAVFLAGALAYRFTAVRVRRRLVTILLVGGSVTLVATPALLRQGRNTNPTVLPSDYTRNILIVLGAVVAATLVPALVGATRRRMHRPTPQRETGTRPGPAPETGALAIDTTADTPTEPAALPDDMETLQNEEAPPAPQPPPGP